MTEHGWAADGLTWVSRAGCPCWNCQPRRPPAWGDYTPAWGYYTTGGVTTFKQFQQAYSIGAPFPPMVTMPDSATPLALRRTWITPEPWARAQNLLLSRLTPAQIGCVRQVRCLPVRSSRGGCYLIGAYAGDPSGVFYFDRDVKVVRVRFDRRGRVSSANGYCVYPGLGDVPPPDLVYSLLRTIETDVVGFRATAVSQGRRYHYEDKLRTWLTRGVFDRICPERVRPPLLVRFIDRWLRMIFGNLAMG